MVNVISKSCTHEGCKKQPNFNDEGQTKALFCSVHKEDGMVNVKRKRIIDARKCISSHSREIIHLFTGK